ncbi:SixA phosphatase family protein [Allopontixanthobacter sp.]|uniref:SixA phosphatase family protein n=1 Tax=Allopontixanthobacter sp. TaxID=2906452 RepID=UPI002ABB2FEC|nr:histidine phosphatase family protein [Allopontixanthobacter sp.]MDZ4306587.1 histidine phosphatase family protein [Allopontixanthobacter sp.]
MKTLGLLRHAKSDWDDLAKRDFDRGLNDRGRRGATLIGTHIARYGTAFDLLLASPAERVRQTLSAALPQMEPQFDERLYLAGLDTLIEVIREKGDGANAMLVAAHNPGLQELLFALVSPSAEDELFDDAAPKYPTAAFAVFELEIDDWTQLAADCGRLVHFKRPRDLDSSLGPEF